MSIFSRKKEEKKEDAKPAKKEASSKVATKKYAPKKGSAYNEDLSWVLLRPRITEKAASMGEGNVYTFDVATRANKIQIKKAIQSLYNVTPVKVRVAKVPAKKVFRRGVAGVKKGGAKAMIYLKKGDSIEFV